MILIYFAILFCIMGYFLISKGKIRPQKKYFVVKAGNVHKLSPLQMSINSLQGRRFRVGDTIINADDYEIYIVEGESMAACGVHTGNGILVTRLLDKSSIKLGSLIVLEIDPSRYNDGSVQGGYKLRQYLCTSSMKKGDSEIIDEVKRVDGKLTEVDEEIAKLQSKINVAREQGLSGSVVISLTTKDGIRDYSIHSVNEIYGLCEYIIPKELIKS